MKNLNKTFSKKHVFKSWNEVVIENKIFMTSKLDWKIKPLLYMVSFNFLTRIMNLHEKIVPNISILNILNASLFIFFWIKPNLKISQKWTLHAVTQNSSFSLTYLKKKKIHIFLALQVKRDNSDLIYFVLLYVP